MTHKLLIISRASGLLVATMLSLGACASAPAISDIGHDKVMIESLADDLSAVQAEAQRGCAIYDRIAVPVSKRTIQTSAITVRFVFLFACTDPSHAPKPGDGWAAPKGGK